MPKTLKVERPTHTYNLRIRVPKLEVENPFPSSSIVTYCDPRHSTTVEPINRDSVIRRPVNPNSTSYGKLVKPTSKSVKRLQPAGQIIIKSCSMSKQNKAAGQIRMPNPPVSAVVSVTSTTVAAPSSIV